MNIFRVIYWLKGDQAISFVAEENENKAAAFIKKTYNVDEVNVSLVDLSKKLIHTEILFTV